MSCLAERRNLYRLFDPDPKRGCHHVSSFDEAWKFSGEKWGIFWSVNEFDGPTRKKENLKSVLSFAVDLDGGDKVAMREKIRKYITPSATVETKNGYHVYYDAVDATAASYEEIVSERLVPLLGGDPKAKDVARILRVPGFSHWKNPDEPYAIKLVQSSDNVYTEQDMMRAFPLPKAKEQVSQERFTLRKVLSFQSDHGLFDRIYSLDCEQALRRVSGSFAVGHEMFSFKRMTNGNLNILVNMKPTSCWIDGKKRIGSADGGGPTIWQWVNWYHRDHKKTYELIKQFFPELFDK